MNALNAHSGMSVSKVGTRIWGLGTGKERTSPKPQPLVPFVFSFLLTFLPTQVFAQGAAPGMSGVQEVMVQYTHFTVPKTSDMCGLEREAIANAINKTLTENAVPAFPSALAKPPMMGVARIELAPEIATIASQSLDCTSWVSLSAQTQSNTRVPPIDILRNVKIVYWQQGALITSSQSTHADQVIELLTKLSTQFAKQYRMDQPPLLPTGSK